MQKINKRHLVCIITEMEDPLGGSPSEGDATLLGNILLRSIVVSVLIRLINGYSVTDGT